MSLLLAPRGVGRRAGLATLCLSALLWLTACAHPGRAPQADLSLPFWSGRLALQVPSDQSQSFSASFELKGSAERGDLALFSPLGSTVAKLAWEPGSALLRANGEDRRFESIEALSAASTGTPLPLGALFDWLAGRATPVPGWEVDLSRLSDGRLLARRSTPPPLAELRIALDK